MAISLRSYNGFHVTAGVYKVRGEPEGYEATLYIAAMSAGPRKGAIRRLKVPSATEFFPTEDSAISAAQALADRIIDSIDNESGAR